MSQSGEENLQGSWVELHFSNGNGSSVPASVSIYNGDMEKILLDAQHESGRSSSKSSHCDSPPRSQTPQDTNRAEIDSHSFGEKNSTLSEEDYIERRREVESILKKTQIGYGIGQVDQKIFPQGVPLNTRSAQLLSA